MFEKSIKLPMMKAIGRTMILGKAHGPMVMVRRLSSNNGAPMYSVFEQLANQVVHSTKPNDLLLPARAKLMGKRIASFSDQAMINNF